MAKGTINNHSDKKTAHGIRKYFTNDTFDRKLEFKKVDAEKFWYRSKQNSQEEIQMSEKQIKKCLASLEIREVKIKTTLIVHISLSEYVTSSK